jgi:hypothetical protein
MMDRIYARSTLFGGTDRQCEQCGERIVCGLDERRADAKFCSTRCRVAAHRQRHASG